MEHQERKPQVPLWYTIAVTSSVAASASLGIWLSFQVSKYGWQGAFWLLWEGSPYPPDFREGLEALDALTSLLEKEERSLVMLEEALQQSKQQSATFSPAPSVAQIWNEKLHGLENMLSNLSYQLDRIASKVDAIHHHASTEKQSRHKESMKQIKKGLSTKIVGFMERTDVMIDFYKECQSAEEGA